MDGSPADGVKAMAGYKASSQLGNIVRQVGEVTAERERRAKTHEEAMQALFKAQQKLDEKERQLEACKKKYEKVMQDLKDKQSRRDELREQAEEANRQMKSFLASVKETCRKTTFLAEDMKAKYHAAERAAERGWSCRQTGTSILTPRGVATPRERHLGVSP
ncbi:Uncharacterized protein SCF082_LOCUS42977 [Durusdinium trenchii]|uniref:Uncharacterized protein n=1 Tax=Durusdinium trenchii TaxID=1381693 RepID=A0ABP0QSI9_9DINO